MSPMLVNSFWSAALSGNGFYRTITIDHTKVGGSDLTDFPILVAGTYSYLAQVGSGGKSQDPQGDDIGFYSDSALTTKLKWEIIDYGPTTGAVIYWVKVPSISHTVDTVIYLGYGQTSITTDQSDTTNVWHSNYQLVSHLESITGTTADSTSNANTGTVTSTPGNELGKIRQGMKTAGLGSRISYTLPTFTTAYTFSLWWSPNGSAGSGSDLEIVEWGSTNFAIQMTWDHTNASFRNAFIHILSDGTTVKVAQLVSTLSAGTFYRLGCTWDGSNIRLYVNGVIEGSPVAAASVLAPTGNLMLGDKNFNASAEGKRDEFFVSNVARSADYLLCEYNTQNDPATFYTVGSEVAL